MRTVPKNRKDIEAATEESANFYYRQLKIQDFPVNISFKEMPGSWLNTINGYVKESSKGKFELSINNKLDFYQSISTMAHEMIHVKQSTRGDLVTTSKGVLWKGKNLKWVPYTFKPWEIEAFKREINLTKKYVAFQEYPSIPFGKQVDLYFAGCSHIILAFLIIQYLFLSLVSLWNILTS